MGGNDVFDKRQGCNKAGCGLVFLILPNQGVSCKNRLTDMENRLVVAKEEGVGEERTGTGDRQM